MNGPGPTSLLEGGYGPVTDADLAAAKAERREIEQWFTDRAADEGGRR
ncbi:hypothetical protein [Streptomyces sp. NPDC007346]